jgi:hypothetical protein
MFHWSYDFYRQNLDASIVKTAAEVKMKKNYDENYDLKS